MIENQISLHNILLTNSMFTIHIQEFFKALFYIKILFINTSITKYLLLKYTSHVKMSHNDIDQVVRKVDIRTKRK